jgi:tRNA 2-selenouridine synthase
MFKDISLEKAISLADKFILDVRSPGEYASATVPGAVNIPLLDNVERSLVGKAYKQRGPAEAKKLAMTIVSPKLPLIVDNVKRASRGKPIVLFCWRGGERSLFMANILSFMGMKVYRVTGGFKAHRRYVREWLERDQLPMKAVVLYGLTGVGKTEVLEALDQRNMPVLDLEGLSCHRGSVFGKIGMPPSPSQKMFEALIVERLKKAQECGVFLVECESKRLGNLMVPQSVMNSMQAGYKVLLYAPVAKRVQRIKEIYVTQGKEGIMSLQNAVSRLTKYLGKEKVAQLNEGIAKGHLDEVTEYLLINYYDPLYGYPGSSSNEYDLSLNTENIPETVEKIIDFIYRLPEYSKSSCRGGAPDGNWKDSAFCPGKPGNNPGVCGARN